MPWFLIGLAVIGIAGVAGWLSDEATKDEKKRQKCAERERECIISEFEANAATHPENAEKQKRKSAKASKKILIDEIKELSKKVAPISKALEQFFTLIKQEIVAETTSPYRRSALRREFEKIEDAKARIVEYKKYLAFEEQVIQKLWSSEDYDGLNGLALASPLLPDEWLYEGKLVLVKMSEIGKPLPRFGHRLLFSVNKAQQQALATNYGSEFPVLVKNKGSKNDGTFFSCVARGVCYVDHILKNQPIDITIDHYLQKEKAYKGILFDGLLNVKLPEMNLVNPSLRSIKGQKIPVYFDSYDMILTYDPMQGDKKNMRRSFPSVSEKPPTFLGQDELDLYIEVDDELLSDITDDDFYSDTHCWTLLESDLQMQELVLGKASVRLNCVPTENLDGLRVIEKASQCEITQVGVDLPFGFVLASKSLNPQQYFGWKYGVEQLYSFASQALLNAEATQDRLKQSMFFKRWEQVVEYLKKIESERAIEFEQTAIQIDKHTYQLVLSKSEVADAAINEVSISSQIREIKKSSYLSVARCCRLMVWNSAQGCYVHAVDKNWANKTEISLDDKSGDLYISASLLDRNIQFKEKQKFQLSISLPNAALQRQQQALTALFEDRMVEPRLKDIFLSPSNYQPEFIEYWSRQEINWHSPSLTPSQKEVVKTALSAKHLAMVQGPPGTGKTTTIVEMLYQLLSHNPHQRILVVSQQHTAVDNVITKFKKKYPEMVSDSVNIIRVGNPDNVDADMKKHILDTVFDDFLTEKIDYVARTAQIHNDEKQGAAYEWGALLKQMKSQLGSRYVSDEFFTTMLADKNMIGATCVGLAGRKGGIDHLSFDVAIVDEAGRATVPELLIPLLRSKKAILIGDHHQLPPSISSALRDDAAKEEMEFLKETFLERSFFEHLFDELPSACTASLKEQFRMSPPIGDLVADLFYTKNGERKLFNGAGDEFDASQFAISDCLIWRDVAGKQHRPKNSTSIENNAEADAISNFLCALSKKQKTSIDVAVITPYGAQKRTIRLKLEQQGAKNDNGQLTLNNLNIKVDTVDSFQGDEAEVVIYSTVRTEGSLQFLLDKKRLNVACSRAKQTLIFFGHSEYLKNWNPKKGEKNLFREILTYTAHHQVRRVA